MRETFTIAWCEWGISDFVGLTGETRERGLGEEYNEELTMRRWTWCYALAFLVEVWVLAVNVQCAPLNDECIDAIALQPNGTIAVGTTIGATSKTISCKRGLVRGKGVFYSVIGTGSRMRISTCTDETEFDAYPSVSYQTGDQLCGDSMACPVLVEDDTPCEKAYGSMHTWNTITGQEYYIFVSHADTEGRYGISLGEFITPLNDVCAAATTIDPHGQGVVRVSGSNINATTETAWCTSEGFGYAQGVWYTVTGTGSPLKATICSDATDFDGELFVSYGDPQSCRSENCPRRMITTDVDGCGYHKTFIWYGETDVAYFINVHGANSGSSGNFELSVVEFETPGLDIGEPDNDECQNALQLRGGGEVVLGSTENATVDEVACFSGTELPSGVWYQVLASSNRLTVSTCHEETTTSVEVSIYSVRCDGVGANQCLDLGSSVQPCGKVPGVTAPTVTWDANPLRPYLIHVYAPTGATFGISAIQGELPLVTEAPSSVPVDSESPTIPPPSALPSDFRSGAPSTMPSSEPSMALLISEVPTSLPSTIPTISPISDVPTSSPLSISPLSQQSFPPTKRNDSPLGSPSRAPSETIDPFSLCMDALVVSDRDDDSFLNQNEYTVFVNQISKNAHLGKSLGEMPASIRQNFFVLRGSNGLIYIFGAKLRQIPEEEQEEYLETVCTETFAAVEEAGLDKTESPATFAPSQLPSHLPSSSLSQPPSNQPSKAPTDVPSGLPTRSPSPTMSLQPSSSPSVSTAPTATFSPTTSSLPSLSPTRSPWPSMSSFPSSNPTASAQPSTTPSDAPSMLPSSSLLPTRSFLPTSTPSNSLRPSESRVPSFRPSLSSAPTTTVSPTFSGHPSASPTTSLRPSTSVSVVPSSSPSTSQVPSLSPSGAESLGTRGFGGDFSGEIVVTSRFVIANTAGLTAENLASGPERDGLEIGYAQTVKEVVDEFLGKGNVSQIYRLDIQGPKDDGSRRLASATLSGESAAIESIDNGDCPSGLPAAAVCHLVRASFVLAVQDVDADAISDEVTFRMNTAIEDDEISLPEGSPLDVVGNAPTPDPATAPPEQIQSGGGGLSGGAIAAIVICSILVVACAVGYGCYRWRQRRKVDPTRPLNSSPGEGQIDADGWRDDEGPVIEDPNRPVQSRTQVDESESWATEQGFMVEDTQESHVSESPWEDDSAFASTTSDEESSF